MKKIIICLSVWTGLAACSREESDLPADGIRPVTFFGQVQDAAPETRALAGAEVDPKYEQITDRYDTVYIWRTAEARYDQNGYRDMEDYAAFSAAVSGELHCVDGNSTWYWNGDKHMLFHAWTLPADGDTPLVSVDASGRFGKVNDFSMNKRHPYTIQNGDTVYFYFRSNLEYFIGAAEGPVTDSNNKNTAVRLSFKHLVAKIIVENIFYVNSDNVSIPVDEGVEIPFYMPNMPNNAYWETGVPESGNGWLTDEAKEPKVTIEPPTDSDYPKLSETDFGVTGKLLPGDAFYIYPCTFGSENGVTGGKFGDIQFRYNGSWFYGSLETITAVSGLEAGQCIGLTLRLQDGAVKGLYPHIVDWSPSVEKTIPQHDRPGIYDENEWKMFVDWLREWDKNHGVTPPPGIFADDGNLNLYHYLDLTGQEDAQYADIGDLLENYFSEKGGKLNGNGHQIMADKQWSNKEGLEDYIDDLYITAEGENNHFE